MKKFTKQTIAVLAILTVIFTAVKCTKHNQVLDSTPAAANTDSLSCIKGTATLQPIGGSAWDGTIEAVWNNVPKLTVHATVPDLGNGTFAGFIGNSTDITLRSMYDAANIYFLVEWNADMKCLASSPWYYNPTTMRWAQEASAPVQNSGATTFRPPFIQDQFVIMFNIANSCPTFNSLSCYAACHVNTTFGDSTMTGGVMHTNGPTELLDVWRARMLQVMNVNQANDCYIDNGAGALNANEVHNDLQVNNGPTPAADGGFSNKQTLKISGLVTTIKVSVPMFVIPSGIYSNGAIMQSDTLPGGKAVKVTKVDTFGVLTLANGVKLDPSTATSGTAFQQVGTGDGPNCIPGSIVSNYTGSRGDVTANAYWTGTGWRLLLKRALKTADAVNDVDLSSLATQPFGVGAMFNGADNEHAIVAGLKLHFNK